MSYGSLARRYSKALLDLSQEKNLLAETESELKTFSEMVRQNHQLKDVLGSFEIAAEKKQRVISELGAKMQLSPLVTNFLLLLAQKDRLVALSDIAREFTRQVDAVLGQARATLVSASPASLQLVETIRQALETKSRKKIILQEQVDPEILGGLLLKMEGSLWDASVRGELQKIKEQMLA